MGILSTNNTSCPASSTAKQFFSTLGFSSYHRLIFPVLLPAHHAVTRRKPHLRCRRNHPPFFRNIPFPRHSFLELYSISQQPCLGKHTSIKASSAPATLTKPPFSMRRGHPYGPAPRTSR